MHLRESVRRPLISQTYGRFIRLPENRAARLACFRLGNALLKNRIPPLPLIYLHGPPGVGKTHLTQLVVERLDGSRSVAARELGKLLSRQTVDERNPTRPFRQTKLLLIEDVQHLSATAAAAVGTLLDERHARRLATLITASTGPTTLAGLPSRLTNRFASGLVVRLRKLGHSSLKRMARFGCAERGLRLETEVIPWLAARSRTSTRTLFGDLTRLQQLGLALAARLNLDTCQRLLAEHAVPDASPFQTIADTVALWFELKPEQIRSRDRRASLLWPRQIAMYIARHKTDATLSAIGAFFGRCDHTTVLHAVRKVEERMRLDPEFGRELNELAS